MASGDERVLVVRVWHEPGREPSFRGRALAFGPAGEAIEHAGVTTSPEVLERWFRRWLRDGSAGAGPSRPDSPGSPRPTGSEPAT